MNIQEGFYSVEVEASDAITRDDISDLSSFMRLKGWGMEADILNQTFTWSESTSPWRRWVADHTQNGIRLTGKWTTRFSKIAKSLHGYEIPEDRLAVIGERLSPERKNHTLHMEFAKFSDWEHGAFEKKISIDGAAPGQCWWSKYTPFRLGMVEDPRGFSVLLYESEEDREANSRKKGIGRCWLVDLPQGVVVFNAYGVPLPIIAAAIGKLLDKTVRKVRIYSPYAFINAGMLDNEGRKGGEVGSGYIIGGTLSEIQLPDLRKRDVQCENCSTPLISTESHKSASGFICMGCISNYRECRVCGTLDRKLQTAGYNGRKVSVCSNCMQTAVECHFCGTVVRSNVHPVWHSSEKVCTRCVEMGRAHPCDTCGRLFLNLEIVQVGRVTLHLCRSDKKKLKESL